jgi:phosphatidylglycerophosphatase A
MMKWYTFLATLGPIGYLPAPGTIATLLALPLVYNVQALLPSTTGYTVVCIVACIIGLVVVHKTLHYLNRFDDPSEIVIDEVVGCMITFIGIAWSVESVLLGFILFRFLDIFKLAGIYYVQQLEDEWGIMLDDVLAGIFSNLILRLFF